MMNSALQSLTLVPICVVFKLVMQAAGITADGIGIGFDVEFIFVIILA